MKKITLIILCVLMFMSAFACSPEIFNENEKVHYYKNLSELLFDADVKDQKIIELIEQETKYKNKSGKSGIEVVEPSSSILTVRNYDKKEAVTINYDVDETANTLTINTYCKIEGLYDGNNKEIINLAGFQRDSSRIEVTRPVNQNISSMYRNPTLPNDIRYYRQQINIEDAIKLIFSSETNPYYHELAEMMDFNGDGVDDRWVKQPQDNPDGDGADNIYIDTEKGKKYYEKDGYLYDNEECEGDPIGSVEEIDSWDGSVTIGEEITIGAETYSGTVITIPSGADLYQYAQIDGTIDAEGRLLLVGLGLYSSNDKLKWEYKMQEKATDGELLPEELELLQQSQRMTWEGIMKSIAASCCAATGGIIGGYIGSLVCPGAGTAIGGALGGISGALLGYIFYR